MDLNQKLRMLNFRFRKEKSMLIVNNVVLNVVVATLLFSDCSSKLVQVAEVRDN